MDSSGVLLALEEQKKWQERKRRIQERIKQLDRRRVYLQRELSRARKKTAEIEYLLAKLKAPLLEGQRPLPPAINR